METDNGTSKVMEAIADLIDENPGSFGVVISNGKPCSCGPGFCASAAGSGFYGFCRPRQDVEAGEDCAVCTAPHQRKGAPCWLCHGKTDDRNAAGFVRALKHGIQSHQIFDLQDQSTEPLSFNEALDQLIAASQSEK